MRGVKDGFVRAVIERFETLGVSKELLVGNTKTAVDRHPLGRSCASTLAS